MLGAPLYAGGNVDNVMPSAALGRSTVLLNDAEAQCIRTLASWFEDGETELHGSEARERIGLSWDTFNVLMRKMHHIGAVEILLGLDDGPVDLFRVSARAVQLARELDARRREASIPADFVDQIQAQGLVAHVHALDKVGQPVQDFVADS